MSRPPLRSLSAESEESRRGSGASADDDFMRFEARLRRSAAQSAAADPDLRGLLTFISARRGRRVALGAPRVAPVADGETPPRSAPSRADEAGRVLTVRDVGPTMRILRVGRPPGLVFRAGQHIRVGLPGNRAAKFSIASAPHEAHVELCIQLVAGGRLTPDLFALRPGDAVDIADVAKGGFTLRAGCTTHLMVATGTGIAPFRSMLRDAWHRATGDRFIVLHGASHVDELPYRVELTDATTVDYRATVSRPTEPRNAGWTGLTGRVDPLASAVAPSLDVAATHVYACGNREMVDAVTRTMAAFGLAVAREIYD